MADAANHPHHHFDAHGLMKFLVPILMVTALGLGAALLWILQPQDLGSIAGSGPLTAGSAPRDLKVVMDKAISGGYPLTLTELELNQWLAKNLELKQGGMLAGHASLDRVLVRLENERAEIVLVRTVFGKTFTLSMFVKIAQMEGPQGVHTEVQLHGGPYADNGLPLPPRGGRFGRLVVPQGFLVLVMPSYRRLAKLFADEIHLGFEEMSRTKIEKGRLILNPRPPADDDPGLPGAF